MVCLDFLPSYPTPSYSEIALQIANDRKLSNTVTKPNHDNKINANEAVPTTEDKQNNHPNAQLIHRNCSAPSGTVPSSPDHH